MGFTFRGAIQLNPDYFESLTRINFGWIHLSTGGVGGLIIGGSEKLAGIYVGLMWAAQLKTGFPTCSRCCSC